MTQHTSHQTAPAPRWTGAKATTFLKELAVHGNVSRAARTVGMSRKSAYRLRARAPTFAQGWNMAMADAAMMREVERLRAHAPHPLLDPRPLPPARPPKQGDRQGL
ncbi:LysR family transcriptional regulator [Aurantiacibacter aquimixticola]|uniref:LysR family transcriptional regulator n=1 Tax=Aurantiacibacter aquimixticola TaxID=1958945 RepID=A0A419RVZ9_9SPHN|nr:LysR family transcriptional regulator [Aurantiacibacter aquimixticola]RJY09944.1 LysR family transcriptional regulator [Aurantiacibacter aquimixticola]